MPSPPSLPLPRLRRLAVALVAAALLAPASAAAAEPIVYSATAQAADCTGTPDDTSANCPSPGAGAARVDQADQPTSSAGPTPDPAGTAPSAPSGADTTSGSSAGDEKPSSATAGDPFNSLGGASPSCRQGAAGRSATNCRATGSPAHRYPIGNYTYDIKIDTGLTHFTDNLLAALQTLASFVWLGFLYAIKGVLLALDWAFHLNLINTNIHKLQGGMLAMDDLFGINSDYFSLALTLAALWGMWHGFVRGKYIETIAGLGACVGLMLIALLIVHDPAGTVGKVGNWGDAAGREVASGVAGAVDPGDRGQSGEEDGLDRGAQAIFNTIVLRPWCALEFGDVNFCLSKPPSDVRYYDGAGEFRDNAATARTVAELWLSFPANGTERDKLYEAWKDDGDRATRQSVAMMQGQSTGKRLAVLVLIVAGLLGALLLLGWIGFWLIAYAALALFFLLIVPFVLLMPALGEAGRRGFLNWAKRLLGALIAKLLYAIVLGVVIYVAALIAEMGAPSGLGWLGVWVIEAVFWWTAFVKRHELRSFLTFDATRGGNQAGVPRRDGLASLYYKTRLGREAARTIHRPLARHVRRHTARQNTGEAVAARSVAKERLAQHAERGLDLEYDRSQSKLGERRELQRELKGVETALKPADEASALRGVGEPRPSPLSPEAESRLQLRRGTLQNLINAPEMHQAEQTVRRVAANEANHGKRWTSEDHDRWIERRREELTQHVPAPDDPQRESWVQRRLMASGIDPNDYREATPDGRQQLLERAERATQIQRNLMRAIPDDGEVSRLGYGDLRALRRTVHDDEWRRARTEARRAMNREAWRLRARRNVFHR